MPGLSALCAGNKTEKTNCQLTDIYAKFRVCSVGVFCCMLCGKAVVSLQQRRLIFESRYIPPGEPPIQAVGFIPQLVEDHCANI